MNERGKRDSRAAQDDTGARAGMRSNSRDETHSRDQNQRKSGKDGNGVQRGTGMYGYDVQRSQSMPSTQSRRKLDEDEEDYLESPPFAESAISKPPSKKSRGNDNIEEGEKSRYGRVIKNRERFSPEDFHLKKKKTKPVDPETISIACEFMFNH